MGEATYYLKAEFENEVLAAEGLKEIRKLFCQGAKAEDWWQDHRDMESDGRRAEFWATFKRRFPKVHDYLKFSDEKVLPAMRTARPTLFGEKPNLVGGDCSNALAGELDFGTEEDVEDNLKLDGKTVKYNAYVLHGASWTGYVKYIKAVFGATRAGWVSDEYLDADKCIQMD